MIKIHDLVNIPPVQTSTKSQMFFSTPGFKAFRSGFRSFGYLACSHHDWCVSPFLFQLTNFQFPDFYLQKIPSENFLKIFVLCFCGVRPSCIETIFFFFSFISIVCARLFRFHMITNPQCILNLNLLSSCTHGTNRLFSQA